VAVRRHRRQRELLGPHGLLQIEHQAHHARLVLADGAFRRGAGGAGESAQPWAKVG
jgi:hypothetical protein